MNVKITIEDASPKELALLLHNLNTLDTDSTMTVQSKTSSFNLGDKGPAQTEAESSESEEGSTEAPAETAKPEKPKRQSSRKPKEQVDADAKATPPTETTSRGSRDEERGGRDDERGERSDADERRIGGRGSLLEKAGEKAKELAGLYRDPKRGEEVVEEILQTFGVKEVRDLAPADFTAAIEAFQRKIDKD